jgi:hypothetical protein
MLRLMLSEAMAEDWKVDDVVVVVGVMGEEEGSGDGSDGNLEVCRSTAKDLGCPSNALMRSLSELDMGIVAARTLLYLATVLAQREILPLKLSRAHGTV